MFFERYGGRGIKICDRWKYSFLNFLSDMGLKKDGESIDRWPDQNGDYEPSNCRWATKKQQSRNLTTNRLIDFKGGKYTAIELSEMSGISEAAIKYRVTHGWGDDLFDPVHRPKLYTFEGVQYTLPKLAKLKGIPEMTFRQRLKSGMSVEEIVNHPPSEKGTRLIQYQGEMLTGAELSRRIGISTMTINRRVQAGWSDEDILKPADGNHPVKDHEMRHYARKMKNREKDCSFVSSLKKKANSKGEAIPRDQLCVSDGLGPPKKKWITPPDWQGYDLSS
jgi:hypothetical protein